MDKYKQLADKFKELGQKPGLTLFYAVVKSIEGDTCTVTYAELDIDEVKLNASGGEVSDKLIITPKEGTMALIGSPSGDLRDLVLLKCDEPEIISYTYGGLEVVIDSTDSKVTVKNNDISLLKLFDDLKSIIEELTVSTPNGPSGTPLPPTILALTEFDLNVNKLFK
jgi:hypothetical protein